jgi:hypothetical protein
MEGFFHLAISCHFGGTLWDIAVKENEVYFHV